jgi:CBS-domain-containing membrane protein
MTKNTPVIFDTVAGLDPISSICDVIKERHRLQYARAELENDARKHKEDMDLEGKRIDFARAELDADVRKHKENMDFARHQVDTQARLIEQQFELNEKKFRDVLERSDKIVKEGVASQAGMRETMQVMTGLLKDETMAPDLRMQLVESLSAMAGELNQSQALLEKSHSRSVQALQHMEKTLQMVSGS